MLYFQHYAPELFLLPAHVFAFIRDYLMFDPVIKTGAEKIFSTRK